MFRYCNCEIPGTASLVQNTRAHDLTESPATPGPVRPKRSQMVEGIVPGGDVVEHLLNLFFLRHNATERGRIRFRPRGGSGECGEMPTIRP